MTFDIVTQNTQYVVDTRRRVVQVRAVGAQAAKVYRLGGAFEVPQVGEPMQVMVDGMRLVTSPVRCVAQRLPTGAEVLTWHADVGEQQRAAAALAQALPVERDPHANDGTPWEGLDEDLEMLANHVEVQ